MQIREIVDSLRRGNLNVNLFLCGKLRNGNYVSFSPNVDQRIFDDLLPLIIDYIEQFSNHEIVSYSPTGYKDETVERYSVGAIRNYLNIAQSFQNADNVENEIDPDKCNFYMLEIISEDDDSSANIRIFRRVTKFKKLHSKGIIAKFNGNTLNKIESKLIGLDGEADIIVINNEVLVLSHYALERIFDLESQFRDAASEFLNQEGLRRGIENFSSFCEDCLKNGKYRKVLSKMSEENINFDRLYNNYKNIKTTIDLFGLDINYNESPFSLIYTDKSQISDILRIFRDSYYRSMINEEIGVDEKIV